MNSKFIIYRESFNIPAKGIASMGDIETAVFVESDHEPVALASFDDRDAAYAEFAKYKSSCSVAPDGAYVGEMYFISTEELTHEGESFKWSGSDCAPWETDVFKK